MMHFIDIYLLPLSLKDQINPVCIFSQNFLLLFFYLHQRTRKETWNFLGGGDQFFS